MITIELDDETAAVLNELAEHEHIKRDNIPLRDVISYFDL